MVLARRELGAAAFAGNWETGRAWSPAAALTEAQTLVTGPLPAVALVAPINPAPQATSDSPFDLTARECEVLRLLVQGHTNPEIAAALFISRKTASNHVTNILAKLGVETRTAAATYAVRQGLV